MSNAEKALVSLIGIGLLTIVFNDSARKAGWSVTGIGTALFLATHASKIKKALD